MSLHCLADMGDGMPFQILPPASSMHVQPHGESDSLVTVCPTSPLVNILRPSWRPGSVEQSTVAVPAAEGDEQAAAAAAGDLPVAAASSSSVGPSTVKAVQVVADFEYVGPLVGHTSGAIVVAAPTGENRGRQEGHEEVLLSCAADGSALAWVVDVLQGSAREASEVRFHAAGISAAAMAPDSSHFMTGGADGSVVTASVTHDSVARFAAPRPSTYELNWWETVMVVAGAVGSSEALGGGAVVAMMGSADVQPSGPTAGSVASDAIGIMGSLGSVGSGSDGPGGPVAVEEGIGEDACVSWTAAQAATSDLLALRVAMQQEAQARKDREGFRQELA